MKTWRVFSMIFMMIAAVALTACSIDEDFNPQDDRPLAITVDGQTSGYEQTFKQCLGSFSEYVHSSSDNYLAIVTPIHCDFLMEFPADTNPYTHFHEGYTGFERDATTVTIGINERKCTYVSGTALITKTDGRSFTVSFSDYKFRWNHSREIIFNGTLTVPINPL